MKIANIDISNAKSDRVPLDTLRLKQGHSFPAEFDEIQLFALLKWKFGPPNGFISFLGDPDGDPDGPFKWDYFFSPCDDLYIQVLRTTNGLEANYGTVTTAQIITDDDVIGYFKNNIEKYSAEIETTIEGLDNYTLILNPYIRHKRLKDIAIKNLNELNPIKPVYPANSKIGETGGRELFAKYQEFLSKTDDEASLNMLVVLESVSMVEAYMNMIIALFVRPEIRDNPKFMEETERRRWKLKLERLNADCVHINKPDMGNSVVGEAKKMFDLRNRIAHSYPDKKTLKIGQMWFDKSFPILAKNGSYMEHSIALNNQLPTREQAVFCSECSEKFIEFLKLLVIEGLREQFDFFVNSNPIGYNGSKSIYGVPFGPTLHAAFFSEEDS